jgi:hypothetical protein
MILLKKRVFGAKNGIAKKTHQKTNRFNNTKLICTIVIDVCEREVYK